MMHGMGDALDGIGNIERMPEWPEGQEAYIGYLKLIAQEDGSYGVVRLANPAASVRDLMAFDHWSRERIERFLEHGAEPDGWERVTEGWHLWAREIFMPPDPFTDA
jgi:hypothetical protein